MMTMPELEVFAEDFLTTKELPEDLTDDDRWELLRAIVRESTKVIDKHEHRPAR